MDEKGSFSVEAAVVLPLFIIFIMFLFSLNISVISKTKELYKEEISSTTSHVEVSRAARVIFQTGGDIYDLFFS